MNTPSDPIVRYGVELDLPLVDEGVFRNVVGHFASGVTVITTADGDQLYGTTVSAVSSLSAEPPMMLICLNRSSATHDVVRRTGRYAINILSSTQGGLARTFARKGDDKFAGLDFSLSPNGLPILENTLASIECVVEETAVGGTHTIFLGRVLAAEAGEGEPLAYYRGAFGNFDHAVETAAYDGTREWVLRRRTALNETVDVDAVATDLRLDPALIENALIRLETESLVQSLDGRNFTPTPLTSELVDQLYDKRTTIETGVLTRYLATAAEEDLDRIRRLGEQILSLVPGTQEALDDFLDLNIDFHAAIVDLAGAKQLTKSYRALNVTTVWRETYEPAEWAQQLGSRFVPRIVAALETRDADTAQAAVREQINFVKAGAKNVIAHSGGRV